VVQRSSAASAAKAHSARTTTPTPAIRRPLSRREDINPVSGRPHQPGLIPYKLETKSRSRGPVIRALWYIHAMKYVLTYCTCLDGKVCVAPRRHSGDAHRH
jgi:hypothetical protein